MLLCKGPVALMLMEKLLWVTFWYWNVDRCLRVCISAKIIPPRRISSKIIAIIMMPPRPNLLRGGGEPGKFPESPTPSSSLKPGRVNKSSVEPGCCCDMQAKSPLHPCLSYKLNIYY